MGYDMLVFWKIFAHALNEWSLRHCKVAWMIFQSYFKLGHFSCIIRLGEIDIHRLYILLYRYTRIYFYTHIYIYIYIRYSWWKKTTLFWKIFSTSLSLSIHIFLQLYIYIYACKKLQPDSTIGLHKADVILQLNKTQYAIKQNPKPLNQLN